MQDAGTRMNLVACTDSRVVVGIEFQALDIFPNTDTAVDDPRGCI